MRARCVCSRFQNERIIEPAGTWSCRRVRTVDWKRSWRRGRGAPTPRRASASRRAFYLDSVETRSRFETRVEIRTIDVLDDRLARVPWLSKTHIKIIVSQIVFPEPRRDAERVLENDRIKTAPCRSDTTQVTTLDGSSFFCEAPRERWPECFARFAAAMREPLAFGRALGEDVAREVARVDGELGSPDQQSEAAKLLQLTRLRLRDGHPLSRFGRGTRETLWRGGKSRRELTELAVAFHARYFAQSTASLALVSPESLDAQLAAVSAAFDRLAATTTAPSSSRQSARALPPNNPWEQNAASRRLTRVRVRDEYTARRDPLPATSEDGYPVYAFLSSRRAPTLAIAWAAPLGEDTQLEQVFWLTQRVQRGIYRVCFDVCFEDDLEMRARGRAAFSSETLSRSSPNHHGETSRIWRERERERETSRCCSREFVARTRRDCRWRSRPGSRTTPHCSSRTF